MSEGIAARAFYKRLGFVEGKLTEEFGCPVQEFVFKLQKDGEHWFHTDSELDFSETGFVKDSVN